jgi:hypothetical protein
LPDKALPKCWKLQQNAGHPSVPKPLQLSIPALGGVPENNLLLLKVEAKQFVHEARDGLCVLVAGLPVDAIYRRHVEDAALCAPCAYTVVEHSMVVAVAVKGALGR